MSSGLGSTSQELYQKRVMLSDVMERDPELLIILWTARRKLFLCAFSQQMETLVRPVAWMHGITSRNATLPVGGRFMTRMKRLWRVGIVITSGSFRSLPLSPCSWIDNSVRFFPFNSVGGLGRVDGYRWHIRAQKCWDKTCFCHGFPSNRVTASAISE